jgi:uncharacterized membrane protein
MPDPRGWRRTLRKKMMLLMCVKLALLALLWALFFSPSHRIAADSNATGRRFGVADQRAPDPSDGASTAGPLSRRSLRD